MRVREGEEKEGATEREKESEGGGSERRERENSRGKWGNEALCSTKEGYRVG